MKSAKNHEKSEPPQITHQLAAYSSVNHSGELAKLDSLLSPITMASPNLNRRNSQKSQNLQNISNFVYDSRWSPHNARSRALRSKDGYFYMSRPQEMFKKRDSGENPSLVRSASTRFNIKLKPTQSKVGSRTSTNRLKNSLKLASDAKSISPKIDQKRFNSEVIRRFKGFKVFNRSPKPVRNPKAEETLEKIKSQWSINTKIFSAKIEKTRAKNSLSRVKSTLFDSGKLPFYLKSEYSKENPIHQISEKRQKIRPFLESMSSSSLLKTSRQRRAPIHPSLLKNKVNNLIRTSNSLTKNESSKRTNLEELRQQRLEKAEKNKKIWKIDYLEVLYKKKLKLDKVIKKMASRYDLSNLRSCEEIAGFVQHIQDKPAKFEGKKRTELISAVRYGIRGNLSRKQAGLVGRLKRLKMSEDIHLMSCQFVREVDLGCFFDITDLRIHEPGVDDKTIKALEEK